MGNIFKVNKKDTRTTCGIFKPSSIASTADFELVNVYWVRSYAFYR